ncbi:MAG: nicotinamide-nucleotide adenylyltransferase [Desulfurococcaceae archaeon]
MVKRILFPGRFQPFHNGHLKVLEDLLKEYEEVIIAVGSAQEGFTCKNPFTGGERMEMINELIVKRGFKNKTWIVPIPDINMPLAWTTHVLSMIPRVNAIASGNPHVIYIFEWLGIPLIKIKLIEPEKYCGTYIRELMIAGDDRWRELVPPEITEYIDKIKGVERVRRVCKDEHTGNRWQYW